MLLALPDENCADVDISSLQHLARNVANALLDNPISWIQRMESHEKVEELLTLLTKDISCAEVGDGVMMNFNSI